MARLYKCDRFWWIAFVFVTGSYAIALVTWWICELSGHNYLSTAVFAYIFFAAACYGACDRCLQCSLRAPAAWRGLDGDRIMKGLQLHGKIKSILFSEEKPEIHIQGGADVQTVWDVRTLALEKAIDYILHGYTDTGKVARRRRSVSHL